MITTAKIRVSYTFTRSASRICGAAGFEAEMSRVEQNTIEYTKGFEDANNDRDLVGMIIDDGRATMYRILGWDVEIVTSFNVTWDVLA
jgi:multimeric flavodoxin WrbA